MIPRICEICQSPFQIHPYRIAIGTGRYCSQICASKAKFLRRIAFVCLICKSEFSVIPSRVSRGDRLAFCSRTCCSAGQRKSVASQYWLFVEKPDDPDDCWGWKGVKTLKGYPLLRPRVEGRKRLCVLATHISFEMHFGPVPPGHQILHRCDNPPCTNYRHLFSGTQKDNIQDMLAKGRGRWQTSAILVLGASPSQGQSE